jgi:iron(III) transport system ATP-binding protein
MSDVVLQRVRKTFGYRPAIDDVDLTIADGEFVVLLGPSGCGKTTTLRCIAGLEDPDSGVISIGGEVVSSPADGRYVPPDKRDIGMVFQSYALWPHMTVAGNVGYPLWARRTRRSESAAAIASALGLVGLEGYGDRYPAELSGGQQQRVALARAVVAHPRLLLFDEPLSNLDAQLRARLRFDLKRIHRETRHTAVYVTHDQSEALALADRVGVMHDGRIEQLGTSSEIFLAPRTHFVAEFVGFDNFFTATLTANAGGALRVRPAGCSFELAIRGTSAPAAGTNVEVAVRSSAIIITPAAAAGTANVIEGRLLDVIYMGNAYQCTVEAGPLRLLATLPLETWSQLDAGSAGGATVGVSLPQADLVMLPVS